MNYHGATARQDVELWVSMEDWAKVDSDDAKKYMANLERNKKVSAADYAYFSAAQQARWSVENDRLMPSRDEDGELVYTAHQGHMAACLSREDIVAITVVQLAILKRLDRNRNFSWVIIFLLIFVAGSLP